MLIIDNATKNKNTADLIFNMLTDLSSTFVSEKEEKDKLRILSFFKTPIDVNVIILNTTITLLFDNAEKTFGINKSKCRFFITLDKDDLTGLEESLSMVFCKYNIELNDNCDINQLCSELYLLKDE